MTAGFVHLRVHSEYSLVDSVVRIKPLLETVASGGMPAVALTDHASLFAMVRFYKAALAAGVKPVVGVDTWLDEGEGEKPSRLVLLCRDAQGYRNLCSLVSRSYASPRRQGLPVLDRGWLDDGLAEGLIALSGGRDGDVARAALAGRKREARARLRAWLARFGDRYYLELHRTGREDEERWIEQAVALAHRDRVPVVATNDVRFLTTDDFEAHEARVCIHQGHTLSDPGRPRQYSEQQYLRTPEEMQQLFSDLPEALANTVEIARRCTLDLELGKSALPDFPVPAGETPASHLRRLAEERLAERLPRLLEERGLPGDDASARGPYEDRLARELDVICEMGFPGYFLIVADFIRWARENGVPVGPGRGSGAGSLVAFVLGITDLDPLRYDLLFERFLNPERVSMPDFDVDFCMEGRDRVIEYVADRYGRECVAQIITFGHLAARAVVRDVGRVLGHPYGFVDKVAKLIPFELGMTLDRALAQDEELKRSYREEEDVRAIIDLAKRLEGLARNAGKHAGGVVIAPGDLTDYTPLYFEEPGGVPVSQFDKDDVEAVGLVKFDFLGLRTLTIIHKAVELVNGERAAGEPAVDITRIPLEDPDTFALLKACQTTAVFQLESRGMRDLIKRLQPDRFDDIVALVALFRPGPLQSGMVDDFINRKHGRNDAPIEYFHPSLKPVLEPTYGVILYQEQVMQIAQVLAGYSLGSADLLRRAMGKKKPEEMARQRSGFVEGATARGVNPGTATYIFDLVEKFAGYGFNKSHSAAYAMLAYQTAWLKAHHPAAFMAAVLSADMDHTDKVVTLIDECDRMGLKVEPPDINRSRYEFDVSGTSSLRYGLGAVKGVGQGAVAAIIAEREAGGPYHDIADFCTRVDMQKVNRRVAEALIRCGAMDGLGPNRATLSHLLPTAMRQAEQRAQAEAAGQSDLFGMPAGAVAADAPELPGEVLPDWSDEERLTGERDTLGLYLTGHPIDAYLEELAQITSGRIAEIGGPPPDPENRGYASPRREVVVAGLVVDLRRRGNRVSLVLDDRSGRIEATLFDDVFQQHRHVVAKDAVLVVEGGLRFDEYLDDWRVMARRVKDMDEARAERAARLLIRWRANGEGPDFVDRLKGALAPFRKGTCPVAVVYEGPTAAARLSLGEDWRVRPTGELLQQLGRLVGGENVRLVYAPRAQA